MRLAVVVAVVVVVLSVAGASAEPVPPADAPVAAPGASPAASAPRRAARAAPMFTLGVSGGRSIDGGYDNAGGDDQNYTLGVWGRAHVSRWISVQLEGQQLTLPDTEARMRTATTLVVVELRKGVLVPTVLAGAGLHRTAEDKFGKVAGQHVEAGIGIELRMPGGLLLGVDLRVGDRRFGDLVRGPRPHCCGGTVEFLSDDESGYGSMRASAGMQF